MKKVGSEYWIWLQTALGPGANTAALLGYYRNPEAIYNALCARELGMLLPSSAKRKLIKVSPSQSYGIQKQCADNGWHIITPDCEEYPDGFRVLDSMPLVLYVSGDPQLLRREAAIAFVGTRHASLYGKEVARTFGFSVAAGGAVVVSGCALGIDSSSHYGALCATGKTIGYLGTGLDADYPKGNRTIRDAIARHGALVSEYPPGFPVSKANFPIRNRLIAASTLGVVVIEASRKSGALITAHYAAQYGKDVFAVPGNITNSSFVGCNHLIRDGARAVFSAADILDEYAYKYADELDLERAKKLPDSILTRWKELNEQAGGAEQPPSARRMAEKKAKPAVEKKAKPAADKPPTEKKAKPAPDETFAEKRSKPMPENLSAEEKKIYSFLASGDFCDPEAMASRIGMDIPSLLAALLSLELRGVISRDENNQYCV